MAIHRAGPGMVWGEPVAIHKAERGACVCRAGEENIEAERPVTLSVMRFVGATCGAE